MRHFVGYWIALLALTKAQVSAALYKFVRFAAGTREEDE